MMFGIGPRPIQNMEMIERHYFRGRVIRDYSFRFGFVIPNSTNEWEFVYDMPNFTEEEMQEIIDAPWEVKSDTFFFAEGRLIIHNRAEYNYAPLDWSLCTVEISYNASTQIYLLKNIFKTYLKK